MAENDGVMWLHHGDAQFDFACRRRVEADGPENKASEELRSTDQASYFLGREWKQSLSRNHQS